MGAVAVFVTLLYLALQLRQNTATVAAATYDGALSGFNDLNLAIATDAELPRKLRSVLDLTEELTAAIA